MHEHTNKKIKHQTASSFELLNILRASTANDSLKPISSRLCSAWNAQRQGMNE